MQYYQQTTQQQQRTGGESYPQGYATTHAAAAAAAARMQWNHPNLHPGQWAAYDFYQQAGYPLASNQSPSAVSSPDHAAATPHNIRDILGVQQQQQQQQQQEATTLVSEVAKTPSYQKSPTSAAAIGTVFHYPSPHHQSDLRSPTTPGQHELTAPSFYLPAAVPGRPFGKHLFVFILVAW